MTALAVVGLACALLVARRDPPPKPTEELLRKIDSLKAVIDSLVEPPIGFKPCWRGNNPPPPYYFTYHVTVRDGRFSFAPHEHWAHGTELRRRIPESLMTVLEGFPQGDVAGEQVISFGERVDRAVQETSYPSDCKLAVTINTGADGNEIGILTRVDFYPVWR